MLPSRDDPSRPKYWAQETSGLLKPVVAKLLEGAELSARDLQILRLYFQQWVDSPAWDANPHADERSRQVLADLRKDARTLRNREDVKRWLEAMEREAMDPL